MKKPNVFILICLLMAQGFPAWAGSDEDAVTRVITDQAIAMTDFPKSKDVRSLLKFFAQDYTSVENGMATNLKDAEKTLYEWKERINLGSPLGISIQLSDIKVQVSGKIAWATFDQEAKIGALGEAVAQQQQKCTGIYTKKGSQWLIQHEHCSTPMVDE
jgi:ketosteroid isomerase-like protein